MRFLGAKYAKMSLWPGFHPDPAGRAHSAGFMGLTYKGMGGKGRAEERGGDVKLLSLIHI